MDNPILTARLCSTNAEQFPDILRLYVPPPACVLDMTYGNGVFWRQVGNVEFVNFETAALDNPASDGHYLLFANDLDKSKGYFHYDVVNLPERWEARFGAVVLDPPYLGVGGLETLKESIDRGYGTRARARRGLKGICAVRQLYAAGMMEAYRVLTRSGVLIVKTMDQVESGRQHLLSHDICDLGRILGFKFEDQFVYVNKNAPTMRHKTQKHARKNHSFWLVFRRRP